VSGTDRLLCRVAHIDGRPIRGGRFLICTGAAPALPPIPGLADGPRPTSRSLFDLTAPPARPVVPGGGPVGGEPAQAPARLGAAAGVRGGPHGIAVDDHPRTSRPHIAAAGDVVGAHQFTHHAGWQGVIAARNLLLPGAARGRLPAVPWAASTAPEVAQAGLTEAAARGGGRR
jgi:pyruvate/2-oxoglutarate dehydrogenase complex dihydrolipoamide dehydrogenase (E3) component